MSTESMALEEKPRANHGDMVCVNCHTRFSETEKQCPACSYPYVIESVCGDCGFTSVKKHLLCPQYKSILLWGNPLYWMLFGEIGVSLICLLIGWKSWEDETSRRLYSSLILWAVGSISIAIHGVVALKGLQVKQVLAGFKQADVRYCSGDIALAERGALQHYNALVKWRARGVKGIDYDISIGAAAGRLFLIYRAKGDSTNAERFFQESAKHFNNRSIALAQKPKTYSHEMLAEGISKADANLDVLWQKSATNK